MPIHLEKSGDKYYYQFGDTGSKYYFNSVNGEQKAYKKVLAQSRAIEYSKHHGEGGIIIGNSLIDFFRPRVGFPPAIRKIISENSDKNIKSIIICRNPIKSNLQKILNIISLGKIQKNMKKLGYDKLVHLFMIVQFYDNKKILVEKRSLDDAERAHILRVLEECGGNQTRAAEILDIDRVQPRTTS